MKEMIFTCTLLFTSLLHRIEAVEEEPPCGAAIVTIGDAWEFITTERVRVRALLAGQDLMVVPQRLAAISSHLNFMRNKAYFLFGENEAALEKGVQNVRRVRQEVSTLASSGAQPALLAAWGDLERSLDTIALLMPEGSLVPSSQMAHILPPAAPTVQLQLAQAVVLQAGQPARIRFFAKRASTEGVLLPVEAVDLVETHGARMHAFVMDESFSDYHHVHPKPAGAAGEYVMEFTPAVSGPYRCWINLVPTSSGREEYPKMDLQQLGRHLQPPVEARRLSRSAGGDGIRAELVQLEDPVGVNSLAQATARITDEGGQPVTNLEPYMGAFAHIVTVHEDLSTLLHFHPHGAIPAATDRGGPMIDFTFRAPLKGYYKLFFQVKREGRVVLLPFGVMAQ